MDTILVWGGGEGGAEGAYPVKFFCLHSETWSNLKGKNLPHLDEHFPFCKIGLGKLSR